MWYHCRRNIYIVSWDILYFRNLNHRSSVESNVDDIGVVIVKIFISMCIVGYFIFLYIDIIAIFGSWL